MIKFVKSKRKFVFYYLIVNIILVMILFMTFSSFPNYGTVSVKKGQPHITKLDTTMEILSDGNTIVTEKMDIQGIKNGTFLYDHSFSSKDEIIDESSVKVLEGQAKLTPMYEKKEQTTILKLKLEELAAGDNTISIQYKVNGIVKRLRDGQLFQFNPWTSKDVDVVDATFKVIFPQNLPDTLKVYTAGSLSLAYEKENPKTVYTEVVARNHQVNTYELRVWDNVSFIQKESTLGRTTFRSVDDVEEDIKSQIKQVQLENQKYHMFQYFLRIMYIIISAIVTITFGILLLSNLIETQSLKKYLRFEFAPSRLGPGSAGKLVQTKSIGLDLESAIRAGVLYMATKGLVSCQKDKMSLQLKKKKDTDLDEIEEITALQKFLFADKESTVLQKEVTNLEMTSRKTMYFFNYRKQIETIARDYHGNKEKKNHRKSSMLRYMKTELSLLVAIVIELLLFLILQMSGNHSAYIGYIGFEFIMVGIAMIAIIIIPTSYYFSQKNSINEVNFDALSEWQYFRTFLFNKKLVREQLMESDEQWREFLMYACVFGAEKVVLSAMKSACPEHYKTVMHGSAKMILNTPEGYFSYTVK